MFIERSFSMMSVTDKSSSAVTSHVLASIFLKLYPCESIVLSRSSKVLIMYVCFFFDLENIRHRRILYDIPFMNNSQIFT